MLKNTWRKGRERSLEIYPPYLPDVFSVEDSTVLVMSQTESQVTNKASHVCPVYLISEVKLRV